MIITISGLPGSGTTTVAKLLQEQTGMKFTSAGEIFRQTAKDKGLTLAEFGSLAESDPIYDAELDAKQIKLIREEDDFILEGRLAAYNSVHAVNEFSNKKKFLRILLTAAPHIRAQRISKRESNSNFDYILAQMLQREKSEKKRYAEYYEIDISDMAIYDIVIPTDAKSPEKIVEIIRSVIF